MLRLWLWWFRDLCFWFPGCADHAVGPFCGGSCGVCGTGLLFENYIVDASILYKKQFPRYMNLDLVRVLWPFLGVVVRGAVFVVLSKMFFDLCGQVFKSTRWMPWH